MDDHQANPPAPGQLPPLTKEQINLLPLKKYDGPVEIAANDEELRAALARLGDERVVGFDIEVRPAFRSGDRFPPALVQLAGERIVVLLQIKKVGDLAPLAAFLAASRPLKAGVAVTGDIAKLHEVMAFTPAGFVDLGKLAGRKGIRANGVRTLAAQVLGFRVSKGAQCSNWERSELAPAQVAYAATDAWICRELYLHLEKMPDLAKKKPGGSASESKKPHEH